MNLRPRQIKAVDDVSAAYRAGYRAPILRAPTGFGKTHTCATIILRALAKGKRVWFLAHLRELLQATSQRLLAEGIQHGWIASNVVGDRRHAVQVCMVQTLARRLDRHQAPDLIIVDEAHLAVANTYQEIFRWAKAGPKHWQPGGAHLLHLTATPQRLDGRGMGEVADVIIETCSTLDLIEEGLLSPIRYFAPGGAPDLSGVRTTAGEFNQGDLRSAMDKPKITGSAVAHYRKLAHGRPAVAFCVSVEHAQHVAAEFQAAGYRAVAISGASDSVERTAALKGLQDGAIDVVCNCALWVAGVDAPAVSCIIQLAPTQSVVKFLQSVGRGLRTHPGKDDCIIFDHAGNAERHGMPTAVREWTLDGAGPKRKREASEVPVKTCGSCFATVASAATHCSCGFEFPVVKREVEHVEGELQEVDLATAIRQRRQEQGKAQSMEDLVAIGERRGMKRPRLWAAHVIRARAAKQSYKPGVY